MLFLKAYIPLINASYTGNELIAMQIEEPISYTNSKPNEETDKFQKLMQCMLKLEDFINKVKKYVHLLKNTLR